MSRIPRSRAFKIVFGVFYSLFAADLYLRLIAPVPLLPRYVVATAYGVRGNQPSVIYYHTTPECYVKMETNSHGVRSDREIPYEKPRGLKRIVVLGDSFGMGYEVNYKEMFLTRLESCLQEAGTTCEVINLSVAGHGNSEELITLQAEGFKYAPDLVLVCWQGTDLDDNVRSGLYTLNGDKLVRDKPSYLPGTGTQQKLAGYALYRIISERFQLYSFIREEVADMIKKMMVRSPATGKSNGQKTSQAVDSQSSARSDQVVAKPRPAKPTDNERLSIALLKQIERESIEHHANTLILDIPDFAFKNIEIRSSFPHDSEGKDFGLRVVHPVDIFRSTPQDQQLYRLRGHFHLTPLACRMVGDLLCDVILKDNLLQAPGPKQ